MSETIKCRLGFSANNEKIAHYFAEFDMSFTNGLDDHAFFIELKHIPEILVRLSVAIGNTSCQDEEWEILSISQHGVALYLAYPPAGDGYVFIPNANIAAIHTVDDDFIRECRGTKEWGENRDEQEAKRGHRT